MLLWFNSIIKYIIERERERAFVFILIISISIKKRSKIRISFLPFLLGEGVWMTLYSWMKCNMTILSLIINSISREIASSLMYNNNVKEVWLNLWDRFSQGNALRIFVLQREVSSLTEGQLSIETYRFKSLSEQLINFQACKCACTCS